MSKYKSEAKKVSAVDTTIENSKVENFMDGTSYTLNPLDTLFIIAASSIFGEPSYYRDSDTSKSHSSKLYSSFMKDNDYFSELVLCDFFESHKDVKTTVDVFTKAIEEALDFDFKGTLELAKKLRNDYFMRLNPNVIFIKAALSSKRKEFNEKYPMFMREIGKDIMLIPNDIQDQFEYYMHINGSKNKLPVIVKRSWTDVLSNLSPYHVNKYKSKLIDLVRIADTKTIREKNASINELMETGTLVVSEDLNTWEQLKSGGKSWKEIVSTIKMPHMALLRNLRGIFTDENSGFSIDEAKSLMELLKSGVKNGKQFPYRYYTAYNEVKKNELKHKQLILDTLEECLDIAMDNFPKLKGTTVCLSDNSGSAWSGFTSEYGSVVVANIANLSSLMTAKNSDNGKVVAFGDRTYEYDVSKRNGLISQLEVFEKNAKNVGGGTEHGIWVFLAKAIKENIHVDNLFIYSDQQAGHGGLYGDDKTIASKDKVKGKSRHIDVLAMVKEYRKKVNPKVNVFSIQVAGYDNSVLPENLYRTSILAGWTGKEVVYAQELINFWNTKG